VSDVLSHAARLATTEARTSLPKLVERMRAKRVASEDLLADAVSIGPHRKGGAILIPEIDVAAAVAQSARLKAEVEQLRDEIEELLLVRALERLYGAASANGARTVDDVARELGLGRWLEGE
jgi:hypothetical protein